MNMVSVVIIQVTWEAELNWPVFGFSWLINHKQWPKLSAAFSAHQCKLGRHNKESDGAVSDTICDAIASCNLIICTCQVHHLQSRHTLINIPDIQQHWPLITHEALWRGKCKAILLVLPAIRRSLMLNDYNRPFYTAIAQYWPNEDPCLHLRLCLYTMQNCRHHTVELYDL